MHCVGSGSPLALAGFCRTLGLEIAHSHVILLTFGAPLRRRKSTASNQHFGVRTTQIRSDGLAYGLRGVYLGLVKGYLGWCKSYLKLV